MEGGKPWRGFLPGKARTRIRPASMILSDIRDNGKIYHVIHISHTGSAESAFPKYQPQAGGADSPYHNRGTPGGADGTEALQGAFLACIPDGQSAPPSIYSDTVHWPGVSKVAPFPHTALLSSGAPFIREAINKRKRTVPLGPGPPGLRGSHQINGEPSGSGYTRCSTPYHRSCRMFSVSHPGIDRSFPSFHELQRLSGPAGGR